MFCNRTECLVEYIYSKTNRGSKSKYKRIFNHYFVIVHSFYGTLSDQIYEIFVYYIMISRGSGGVLSPKSGKFKFYGTGKIGNF